MRSTCLEWSCHSPTRAIAARIAAAPDYQLRVACRDTAELDALLRALRLRLGAADTDTTIVLRSGPPR